MEIDEVLRKIESASTVKEAADTVFEEIRGLTKSQYCYVAYVDPENRDSVGITFSHLTEHCEYYESIGEARFKLPKSGKYGGLLGYSLDKGESFFTNDPQRHPAAHGIPEGHQRVFQFLSVAVKDENGILGQIVLGNPEEDYNESHLKLADEVGNSYAKVLRRFYMGEIPLR